MGYTDTVNERKSLTVKARDRQKMVMKMDKVYELMKEPLVRYIEDYPSWDMQAQHYHNTTEIYLLTGGDRVVTVNDTTAVIKAGDLLIIKPYFMHSTCKGKSDNISRCIISVSEEMFSDFLKEEEIRRLFSPLQLGIVHLKKEDVTRLTELWKFAADYYLSHDMLKIKLAKFYVIQILMLLGEMELDYDSVFEDSGFDEETIDLISHIHQNFRNPDFSLDSMLEYSHMGKSRLYDIFNNKFHTTFLKYLNFLRINEVRKELDETDKPLSVIAQECGFASVQTMTRNFISEYSMTPAAYRKQQKI